MIGFLGEKRIFSTSSWECLINKGIPATEKPAFGLKSNMLQGDDPTRTYTNKGFHGRVSPLVKNLNDFPSKLENT
jgi:hypothetical protein